MDPFSSILLRKKRVRQITIMSYGNISNLRFYQKRLDILGITASGCRITHVTYTQFSTQAGDNFLIKNVTDQTHRLMQEYLLTIITDIPADSSRDAVAIES